MSLIIPFTKDSNIEINEEELKKIYSVVLFKIYEDCGWISDEGKLLSCVEEQNKRYRSCTTYGVVSGIGWHTHSVNNFAAPSTTDILSIIKSKERRCSIIFTGVGIFVMDTENNYEFFNLEKVEDILNSLGFFAMAKTRILFYQQFKLLELDKLHKQFINFDSIIEFYGIEYLLNLRIILKKFGVNVRVSLYRYPFDINNTVSFSYFIDMLTAEGNHTILDTNRTNYTDNFFTNNDMESCISEARFHHLYFSCIDESNYVKTVSLKNCLQSLSPKYLIPYLDTLTDNEFIEIINDSTFGHLLYTNPIFYKKPRREKQLHVLEAAKEFRSRIQLKCTPITLLTKEKFYNENLFFTSHSTQHFFTILRRCVNIDINTIDIKEREFEPVSEFFDEGNIVSLKERLLNNLLKLVGDEFIETRRKENFSLTEEIRKINIYLIEKYSKNLTRIHLKDCYDVCLILKKVVEDSNYECSPSIIYAYRKILMK